MSSVIRSSMSSIPEENWERAFGVKDTESKDESQVVKKEDENQKTHRAY